MLMQKNTMTGQPLRSTAMRACAMVSMLFLALAQSTAHDTQHTQMSEGDSADQGHVNTPREVSHANHSMHLHRVASNGGSTRYRRSVHRYSVPDVTLIDMDGTEVFLPDALNSDSPTMMNFIFTSCTTICPVMSMTFSQSQKELSAELDHMKMISISIDPEYDTPERLQAYAKRHNAGDQWRFLTGSRNDIVAVQRAFDAFRGGKMSHEPFTLLRASVDMPWVRLDGFASSAELVAEYHRAVTP